MVGLVSIFSVSIIVICTIFVFLVSKNVNTTLEALSQTIESIIDDNPKDIFSTIEDTMLSKLQSQVIKLSDILKSHNIRQRKEKDDLASLISDISHQLKTPLANLNIYNSLLLDTSLSDDRRIEFTKNMQSQIEKLNWLMESLIKMSKLETGIIKLNIKNQSITQTVLQAILMVSPKAEQKGINITFSSEKDIICNHDTKWTQEAIFNILDNGIKYSPDNTEIHMSIIKYELFCRIDIQDKGDGIIESDINKIFTRFYRGENSKNIDGVGIGLFLSRKIVSQQGGYIKVKSILGRGSVFSVFLPFET
ncbi:HAMP domain-containing histidine kinase [Tissierella sp. DSM 105185]|uniref:histidine kinase n=1 Tax=Tissierella pigra TaxID=2607614 RepID=A0A6N7XL22_9FIRM|nr:HAMP domain-containing histidine kinase [Tissierella pigra]